MRLTTHPAPLILLAAAAAACSPAAKQPAADSGASTTTTTTTATADSGAHAMGAMAGDADRAATGAGGVPAGYVGRTDREGTPITGAKYTVSNGRWEVMTGPAHIVYAAKDTVRGAYTATATFDQLESPAHPEAYGIFIGGQHLDGPQQRYTYFLVRGTGQYLVKVRDGATTKDVVAWTSSDAVPKADASGKATYRLTAHTTADSVHFLVNDKVVAAAAKSAVPTDGVAGVRINHNLHVMVTPLVVKK